MTDMAALLETEIPRLRRYARALIGDVTRADDLVESCLRRAVHTMHPWQPGTEFRTWLFSLLQGQISAQIRRAVREIAASATPADKTRSSPSTLTDLRRALALLPEEQRQVVLLTALEGFRYSDVARILDVPVGTVRSRLFRGRNALRLAMTGAEKPQSSVAA
jgi:RNA polymerase sigma-70 factor, ECF subfamily